MTMIKKITTFILNHAVLHQYIKQPTTSLATFNRNPRPWHMPLVAAIAVSFPVLVGAYLHNLAMGLLASLGSMVILNLPYAGGLLFRMTAVLACSFGMVACFAVGLIAHRVPILTVPLMMFITFWITLFSRFFINCLHLAGYLLLWRLPLRCLCQQAFHKSLILLVWWHWGHYFRG